jgi:hypothetical protein
MKRLSITIVLFLVACLLGCGGRASRKRPPVSLIPANSLVAISVKWPEVRKEPYFNKLIKGDAIEQHLLKINILDSEINDLVVLSDRQCSMSGTAGIILSGSYDQRKVISHVRKLGWSEENYRRHKIYLNSSDNICVAALSSGLIVFGTKDAAQSVIDVEVDPKNGLAAKQPFDELMANSIKQRRPISMFVSFPQEVQDMANAALELSSTALGLAGIDPLGELFNKIGYARAIGCSISRSGGSFPVELTAIMKDDNSASLISGTLNLMKSVTARMPKEQMSVSERQHFQSIQSMLISRDDNLLKIGMLIPEKELMR